MSLSLIEELPRIVREGKAEVARIMERLSSPNRLTLQTNELVLPFKDQSGLFRGTVREMPTSTWFTLIAPKVLGWRRVCVKAVDMFGFENVVVKEVKG